MRSLQGDYAVITKHIDRMWRANHCFKTVIKILVSSIRLYMASSVPITTWFL